jgi:hypothetical protein
MLFEENSLFWEYETHTLCGENASLLLLKQVEHIITIGL